MQPIEICSRTLGGGGGLERIVTERELRHRHPDLDDKLLTHDDSPAHALSEILAELVGCGCWASDWDSNDSGKFISNRWQTLNEATAELLA